MKAKTKFMHVYKKLPEEARRCLVFSPWKEYMSLAVCKEEIAHDTKLGKQILERLGFEDVVPNNSTKS